MSLEIARRVGFHPLIQCLTGNLIPNCVPLTELPANHIAEKGEPIRGVSVKTQGRIMGVFNYSVIQ